MALSDLARTVHFEDRPDLYVVSVRYHAGDELVRAEAYPSMKTLPDEHGQIVTVDGTVAASDLERIVQFAENGHEFVIATEFRHNGQMVRRDAHVILKESSAVARALAASIG